MFSRSILLATLAAFLSSPFASLADEWSGKLVDANCTNSNGGPHACDAGPNTTAFGLVVAGQPYLFNGRGNRKASEAVKQFIDTGDAQSGAYSSSASNITVSVTGTRAGKTLLVNRVVIQ